MGAECLMVWFVISNIGNGGKQLVILIAPMQLQSGPHFTLHDGQSAFAPLATTQRMESGVFWKRPGKTHLFQFAAKDVHP